jgi:stage II sporulation SpoE-like protein
VGRDLGTLVEIPERTDGHVNCDATLRIGSIGSIDDADAAALTLATDKRYRLQRRGKRQRSKADRSAGMFRGVIHPEAVALKTMIQVDPPDTPPAALDFVRLAYATRHSSDHRRRGGDFIAYDFGAGRLTLTIGDASAKQSQGLRMVRILRRSVRTSLPISSPSRILCAMSDALMQQADLSAPSPTFAAVLVATIDLEWGVLSYAAAGVEGGLVFGDRSAHVHLGATGPLLGIERLPIYEERMVRFLPGDTLVAYTDGVTEAPAATRDGRLGSYGLVRSMRRIQPAGELTIRASRFFAIDS